MTQPSAIAVMVTRPGDIGKDLSNRFQKRGLQSCFLPTLEIVGQSLEMPIEDFERAIFISVNAVKYSFISHSFKDLLPAEVIAVGSGTAKALAAQGCDSIIVPKHYNSEGLLELEQLQSVSGRHILIVKGRGGREKLQQTLTSRGAICHELDVYCRVFKTVDAIKLNDFLSFNGTKITMLASIETLESMDQNISGVRGLSFDKKQLTLVVASERIAQHAKQMGYDSVHLAATASNDAMFEAVECLISSLD